LSTKQTVMIKECSRKLLLETEIPLSDLRSRFQENEFYKAIYYELSVMVAEKIFEKIGPAIDKAIKGWQEQKGGE